MASGLALAQSAEDLRREIEELHRQQREVCCLLLFFFTYAFIKKSVDLIGMRWGNCPIRMSLEHKFHRRERKEGTEKEKIEGKFNPNFEYSGGVMPDDIDQNAYDIQMQHVF
jgi:hypothetical protein